MIKKQVRTLYQLADNVEIEKTVYYRDGDGVEERVSVVIFKIAEQEREKKYILGSVEGSMFLYFDTEKAAEFTIAGIESGALEVKYDAV